MVHPFYSDITVFGVLIADGITTNGDLTLVGNVLGKYTIQPYTQGGWDDLSIPTKKYVDDSIVGIDYWNLLSPGELQLDLAVTGAVIPLINDNNDLGSDTNRWKDLYLGSNIDFANTLAFVYNNSTTVIELTATSLITNTGVVISANLGGGQLSLDYLSAANNVLLSNDSGGFARSGVFLSDSNKLATSLFNVDITGNLAIYTNGYSFSFNSTTNAIFQDAANNRGIEYFGNYESNFLPNTLVTKLYVDTEIANNLAVQSLVDLDDVYYPSGTPVGGDILAYNDIINQWEPIELPISFAVTASRNSNSTNIYLNQDQVAMNVTPFILPCDCKLKYISASTNGIETWTAEVHVNGVLVPGALLTITATNKAKIKFLIPIQFNEDDEVMLYCNGTGVNRPKIIAFFG